MKDYQDFGDFDEEEDKEDEEHEGEEEIPEGVHVLKGPDLEYMIDRFADKHVGEDILSKPIGEWRVFEEHNFPRHALRYSETRGCVITLIDYETKDARLNLAVKTPIGVVCAGDFPFHDGNFDRAFLIKRNKSRFTFGVKRKDLGNVINSLNLYGIDDFIPADAEEISSELLDRAYTQLEIRKIAEIIEEHKEYFMKADPRVIECLKEAYELADKL